jgi:hypothetical protein
VIAGSLGVRENEISKRDRYSARGSDLSLVRGAHPSFDADAMGPRRWSKVLSLTNPFVDALNLAELLEAAREAAKDSN